MIKLLPMKNSQKAQLKSEGPFDDYLSIRKFLNFENLKPAFSTVLFERFYPLST